MMRALAALLALAAIVSARADSTPLAGARAALDDGLPQVAIHETREAIARDGDPDGSAGILLTRALLDAGRPAEAVTAIASSNARETPEGRFWLAQSLAAKGDLAAAAREFSALSTLPAPAFHDEVLLGLARVLRADHRPADAIGALSQIPSTSRLAPEAAVEEMALLLDLGDARAADAVRSHSSPPPGNAATAYHLNAARIALHLGDPKNALEALARIHSKNASTAAQIAVLEARGHDALGDTDGAELTLERFIQDSPTNPAIGTAFDELDRFLARHASGSNGELRRWAADNNHPQRAAYAKFYLGKSEDRLGKPDRAAQCFRELIDGPQNLPMIGAARIGLAKLLMAQGRPADACQVLGDPPADARSAYLLGEAKFRDGRFAAAAESFLLAAAGDTQLQENALRGAAIALAFDGVATADNPALSQLPPGDDTAAFAAEIELLEAGKLAGKEPSRAEKILGRLASTGPPSIRRKAQLALDEMDYTGGRPRRISLASPSDPADPDTLQREKLLEIYRADDGTPGADDAVVEKTAAFLKQFPSSPLASGARMKLAEALYRRGDYLRARVEFEEVARQPGDTGLGERALFFAAQAGSKTMDPSAIDEAFLLYEEVAKGKGPLAWRARYQQALLLNALSRQEEALALLNNVIELCPEPELRYAARIKRGDTLYSLAAKDPSNARKAIETWQLVSTDPGAPERWKKQALAKEGAALGDLGETDAALAAYYDALSPPKPDDPEFFWFYKAGFDAAALLESKQKWPEAIRIYQKMAAVKGPRAAEAGERINRLRLENFIWDR